MTTQNAYESFQPLVLGTESLYMGVSITENSAAEFNAHDRESLENFCTRNIYSAKMF
jgi:hypothetical protein